MYLYLKKCLWITNTQKYYAHILKKIDKYKQCIDQNKLFLQAALYCEKSLNKDKILKSLIVAYTTQKTL